MRAYYIDTQTDKYEVIDVEPKLDEYHRLIHCDCIDIVMREVQGRKYNIVLDDEGLLKPNRISATSVDADLFGNQERLAGSLLIFGVDKIEYDLRSLTDDEVKQIKRRIIDARFADGSKHPVFCYSR